MISSRCGRLRRRHWCVSSPTGTWGPRCPKSSRRSRTRSWSNERPLCLGRACPMTRPGIPAIPSWTLASTTLQGLSTASPSTSPSHSQLHGSISWHKADSLMGMKFENESRSGPSESHMLIGSYCGCLCRRNLFFFILGAVHEFSSYLVCCFMTAFTHDLNWLPLSSSYQSSFHNSFVHRRSHLMSKINCSIRFWEFGSISGICWSFPQRGHLVRAILDYRGKLDYMKSCHLHGK